MNSLYVPISISAKSRDSLTKAIMDFQAMNGGKCSIVTIYFDSDKKEHVCWIYPLKSLSGGVI